VTLLFSIEEVKKPFGILRRAGKGVTTFDHRDDKQESMSNSLACSYFRFSGSSQL
jgi:hypothetical protein